MNDADRVVGTYLADVEVALGSLPASRRRDILDEIASHLADALAADGNDVLIVRNVIEQLGAPEDIAAAAGVTCAEGSRNRLDPWVPWLVLFGGLVVAIGWIVGIAILWSSTTWKVRDKVIATLVLPGGLLPLVLLLYRHTAGSCITRGGPGIHTTTSCVTSGVIHPAALAVGLFVITLTLPVATFLHLERIRRAGTPPKTTSPELLK